MIEVELYQSVIVGFHPSTTPSNGPNFESCAEPAVSEYCFIETARSMNEVS